jgi:hypothetical protein
MSRLAPAVAKRMRPRHEALGLILFVYLTLVSGCNVGHAAGAVYRLTKGLHEVYGRPLYLVNTFMY